MVKAGQPVGDFIRKQTQGDYFGAHTYRRVDQDGVFHTEWMLKQRPEVKITK